MTFDSVTKQPYTGVEIANLAQGKAQLAQGKAQTAQLKNLNKSSQVTNAKLSELNQTSKLIAKANEELVRIQSQALDESNKQTSLLDAQLQIANINELEKNRQNQIKQAAFSIEQQIELIKENNSNIKRYFLFIDQLSQINIVGLTPDAPNEISDKQYVRDTLKKFNEALVEVKSSLSSEEIKEVDEYYINLTNLENSIYFKNECFDQISQLINPEAPIGSGGKYKWLYTSMLNENIISPSFPLSKDLKNIATIFYWVAVYYTYGAALSIGVYYYYQEKKQKFLNLSSYKTERNNLEISLTKLNAEIEKYSSLTLNFKKKYSIEA